MKTSDTPRTDAAYAASTGAGIYELFMEAKDIERELAAAKARIAALEADNKALRDRFAEADTERNGALAAVRAASSAIDTLAEMRADAQQARCDEEWAHEKIMPVDFAPVESGWEAGWWDGEKKISTTAPTIHAALRALRAKVEGGTQ